MNENGNRVDEIRRGIDAVYEERVYGGRGNIKGEYDDMWRVIDKLLGVIKENEEDWHKRNREETAKVKKEEKEVRLRKVAEKKKKYEKLGKESKTEKKESEERIRRKLAMIEIRKNLWRSYRDDGKMVKLEDYLVKSKRGKEKANLL